MSDAELTQLASEVRGEVVNVVSQTGGHLGSSLGVVELSVAIHAVFNTPRDKLVWDVGHQCYPHKILTGRRDRMTTLRQKDGISGFTKRAESEYDPFGAAHSSTSISAALGFATARDLGMATGDAIAVIGDGSISAGMAYEAMNNAGHEGRRLFVILNDNEMSIAPPVGAMSKYLSGLYSEGSPLPILKDLAEGLEAGLPAPLRDSALEVATGQQQKSKPNAPSYTSVFGNALVSEAERDDRIVAVTAAMPSGTGVDKMADRFPGRTFDVGIAEQHAVTFAAGLAATGMKPFCAIYSSFLQRGYDQIVHDVALQNLPVRFAVDRAGLVGADGPTHAGAFDIGYLTPLPNFTVMAAADEAELVHMVATAAAHDAGPIALRYPRGAGVGVDLPAQGQPMTIGRGRVVREGTDVAVLSFGAHLSECLVAAEQLEAQGVSVTVADARFCKPLDEELIRQLIRHHGSLITVELAAKR